MWLTQVVDNVRLAPRGPVAVGRLGSLADAGVQQQHVEAAVAQRLERLLRKRPDGLEVGQLERQHRHAVPAAVEAEGVVRRLRRPRVPGAEDEAVRLGLAQELLDELEALVAAGQQRTGRQGRSLERGREGLAAG